MAIRDGFIRSRPVELGRIAIGTKSSEGYPQKLDHFIFTRSEMGENKRYPIDKEVTEIYEKEFGKKPKSIVIVLPFDTPDEVFHTAYGNYRKAGVCDCYGDGITARRNIGGEWQEVQCGYEECTYKIVKRQGKPDMVTCKPRGILSVWLPLVRRVGGVFKLRTSSRWSIGNIMDSLEQFYSIRRKQGKTLKGLVCKLTVYPKLVVTDRKKNSTQKVYIMKIEYDGTMEDLIRDRNVFAASEAPKEIEGETTEIGEDPDIVEAEFADEEGDPPGEPPEEDAPDGFSEEDDELGDHGF
ncbi:MAG: hypothetical protein SVK08_02105 [Halobacteriota archaeon]|nr:hypothetical protein [Halobacteriota archaeon]